MLVLTSPAPAQQKKPEAPKVDEAKVAAAIKKGMEWLLERGGNVGDGRDSNLELVLLTLVHAGVPRRDETFRDLMKRMLEEPLSFTYRVSLQAMVLEEIDRVKHQPRLHQCAQFLVDNQARNGQWSYGEPTTYPVEIPKPAPRIATGAGANKPVMFNTDGIKKPTPEQYWPVKKNKDGPGGGDNSNTQYACLGLRACHDSGIVLPKEVVQRAQRWFRDQQHDPSPGDGGYGGAGWGYGERGREPWGSMTAGAVGSLSICDYILGENWKQDKALQKGAEWLGSHFTVEENPCRKDNPRQWHYYYLYGLERAGMLYETAYFGKRDWYAEGANYLLQNQKADGQWSGTTDTCFAILFLRRATRPFIETGDKSRK